MEEKGEGKVEGRGGWERKINRKGIKRERKERKEEEYGREAERRKKESGRKWYKTGVE